MAHTTTTDQSQYSRATKAFKTFERELRQLQGSDADAGSSYVRMPYEDDENRRRIEGSADLVEDRDSEQIDRATGGGQLPGRRTLNSRDAERGIRKEKSQLDHYHNGQRRRRRRHHHHTSSPSSSDSASDSDEDSAHQRPNPSLYAWVSQPAVHPELDHRSILKLTMDARNNYTKGGKVSNAVRSLLEHSNLPNFPTSKWRTVLSDDYMDLQKVLGGVESAIGEVREVTTIGGLEIGYGRNPPSKAIVSASDWATAFDLYRGAVLFAFPHRGEELLAYRDYINDTFRVFDPQHHPAVIKFDQRCRILYSRTHARALSDTTQFASEYSKLTVQVAYAAASSSPLAQRPASQHFAESRSTCEDDRLSFNLNCTLAEAGQVGTITDGASCDESDGDDVVDPICYRYNYATCSGCSYRHVCLICEHPEHIADNCPEKSGHSQPQSDNDNIIGVFRDEEFDD